ncbi:MAG TPA: serine/threonine-protein kinase [Polyangiaceae bacterium]|nr:serine/threonine-protein kinase [Polyangiaceae bacterium]
MMDAARAPESQTMSNEEVTQTGQVGTDHGRTGKYTILMELGSGGSATVSAAMAKGIAGFSKVVVLKTIRDGLGSDDETIKMFLGEARLSARMNHPNIVQVYEVYKKNKLPVIVMEYLEGQSLAVLLSRTLIAGTFPRDIGIAVLAKTLAGLHYAHTLTDYSGEPLHLVHRDVSPHNVMICYDGQVKLVDFGIAKLRNQNGQTRTGVIKGKVNYMAPEQVTGEVDHRSDVFAVGVMLWEVLAGRRYWGETTDAAIIGRLLTGQLPALKDAAPDVDAELDRICAKALAFDIAQRYASAADMQRDLEAYLKKRDTDISQLAIASLMDSVLKDVREKTKAALQQKVMALADSVTGEIDANDGNDAMDAVASPAVTATLTNTRRSPAGWLFGVVALGALLAGGLALTRSAPPTPPVVAAPVVIPAAPAPDVEKAPSVPDRVRLSVVVAPQEARLFLDNRRLASNPFRDSLPRDTAEHTFRAEAEGFEPHTERIRLDADADLTVYLKPVRDEKAPAAAPAPSPPRSRQRFVAAAPKPPAPAPAAPEAPKEAPPPAPKESAPKAAAPGEDLRPARPGRKGVEFDDPYKN